MELLPRLILFGNNSIVQKVLSYSLPDLIFFQNYSGPADSVAPFISHSFLEKECDLLSRAEGWVAGAQRGVEVYSFPDGFLLKVVNVGDFLISQNGQTIAKRGNSEELTQLECEAVLGPVLVFALALRSAWSLHASAAMFREKTIAFLGESGQGKSTLAAYLSQNRGWRRVADDILPATMESSDVKIWPHFPQLKLPPEAQPFIGLSDSLPLDRICLLTSAGADEMPALEQVSPAQAAKTILSHTAGARMFPPDLLARHLAFSAEVAKRMPVYRLTYPHRKEALPLVKSLLQDIC